jgi:hypothetical protein
VDSTSYQKQNLKAESGCKHSNKLRESLMFLQVFRYPVSFGCPTPDTRDRHMHKHVRVKQEDIVIMLLFPGCDHTHVFCCTLSSTFVLLLNTDFGKVIDSSEDILRVLFLPYRQISDKASFNSYFCN